MARQNETVSAANDHVPPTGSVEDRDAPDGAIEATTIERTLALVGDRWTILILRAAFRGIRRFDEFCADLGIARPMLTRRLRKLVGAGLMTREPYQEHPARFEYRLTSAGLALSPVLVALVRWGDQHLPSNQAKTMLVHAPCGTELVQGFWCDTCATVFGPGAIRSAHPR